MAWVGGGVPEGGDERCEPEAREVALDAIEVVHQQEHHLRTQNDDDMSTKAKKEFRVDKKRWRRTAGDMLGRYGPGRWR